jgi:hypothetical protein
MAKYLGQTPVVISEHPQYSKYTPSNWAMMFIGSYGQIDGDHHKSWVLDQVARILKGTPVIVETARWDDGQEEDRFWVSEVTSIEYNEWREMMLGDIVDGEHEYGYNEGVAP